MVKKASDEKAEDSAAVKVKKKRSAKKSAQAAHVTKKTAPKRKSHPTQAAEQFDIVVVGGGMVGLSVALGLAQSGYRVALVEGREPDLAPWPEPFDLRVSAINYASQQVYQHLQVWPAMRQQAVYAYQRMHVWDDAGAAKIHFESADVGQPNLGHIVENRVMLDALWRALENHPQVNILCPETPAFIDVRQDSVLLQLQRQRLSAKLLLGADGSRSWVRQQLAIAVQAGDYEQSALVATIKLEKPHQECAWQSFLSRGPLALLPMRDNHCSIVWSTSKEHAQQLLELQPAAFNTALQEALHNRFGAMQVVGERALFPLRYVHSREYVRPRVALIGDAAHTVHPLAGQGVNLGLMDCACLLQVLGDARQRQQDPGQYRLLRRYERWRRGDNSVMLHSMTGINQLFTQQNPLLMQIRGLGLRSADGITALKQMFIKQAMGLQAHNPEMASRHRSFI